VHGELLGALFNLIEFYGRELSLCMVKYLVSSLICLTSNMLFRQSGTGLFYQADCMEGYIPATKRLKSICIFSSTSVSNNFLTEYKF
jgi:hypothetical protein